MSQYERSKNGFTHCKKFLDLRCAEKDVVLLFLIITKSQRALHSSGWCDSEYRHVAELLEAEGLSSEKVHCAKARTRTEQKLDTIKISAIGPRPVHNGPDYNFEMGRTTVHTKDRPQQVLLHA